VERVIAANVDRAVIVAAIREPVLRPRLLDRYLVAIGHGGASAVLAITKVDLASEQDHQRIEGIRSTYEGLGLPVVACSTTTGLGIDALRRTLAGGLSVLVGQSGVGKSSLINALAPRLEIDTRETGRSHKGRHTTTASTLHRLDDGTRVIDTPGVREFGLWEMTRGELRSHFHEFDELASRCRYADCSHDHEPACAVREAAARGAVRPERYESYLRLLASIV
jgi:ribosome biogenesis GTPase